MLYVPYVTGGERLVAREPLQELWQVLLPFGPEHLLYERAAIVFATPLEDQFAAQGTQQVCLATAGRPKGQNVLPALQETSLQEHAQVVVYPYRQPAPIEGVQRLLQWQPRLVQPAMNSVAMSLLLLLLY